MKKITGKKRRNVAEILGEGVKGNPESAIEALMDEYFKMLDLLYIEFNDYLKWYSMLLAMYESTDLFEDKQGFTVEKVVSSGGTYTYSFNLQPYKLACLCPVYISGTSNPQDCALEIVIEAYPPPTMDVRTVTTPAPKQKMPHIDDMPSLPNGFFYTIAPKMAGTIKFYNDDATGNYDAYCVYHADYLPMDVEDARKLIYLVRNPLIKRIEEAIGL